MKANGHVFKYGDNVDTDVIIVNINDIEKLDSTIVHLLKEVAD